MAKTDSDSTRGLGRRAFLGSALLGGAAVLGAAACGKSALTCDGPGAGVTPADAQLRATLEYRDIAPQPEKACSTCSLFVPPSDDGCGSCKVVRGPVNPKGTCKLYLHKAADAAPT